jgi:hypothetical protein
VSLRDQRRVLAALDALTRADPATGTTVDELAAHMGRATDDLRMPLTLNDLAQAGMVELGEGGMVRITPKGADMLVQ